MRPWWICLILSFSAYADQTIEETKQEKPKLTLEEQMKELREEIDELAQPLECKDNTHCHFLGIGVRSCGGNKEHVVFSTFKSPQDDLKKKIAEYNKMDQQNNTNKAIFSACPTVYDPIVKCRQSQCKRTAPYRPGRAKRVKSRQ